MRNSNHVDPAEQTPSLEDLYGDSCVSVGALPADEPRDEPDLLPILAASLSHERGEARSLRPEAVGGVVYCSQVAVQGRRFKSSVFRNNRRYAAGTWDDESAAWSACARLVAEMREDDEAEA